MYNDNRDFLERCFASISEDLEAQKQQNDEVIHHIVDEIRTHINAPIPTALDELKQEILINTRALETWKSIRWIRITAKWFFLIVFLSVVWHGVDKFYQGVRWHWCQFTEPALNLDQKQLDAKCTRMIYTNEK